MLFRSLEVMQHAATVARAGHALDLLELLLEHGGEVERFASERKIPAPLTGDVRRYDPGTQRERGIVVHLVGLPGTHVEHVGHHARARARLGEDLRSQQALQLGEEPHEDHVDFREVGIEHIALEELRAVGKSILACRFVGLAHQLVVEVHAPAGKHSM